MMYLRQREQFNEINCSYHSASVSQDFLLTLSPQQISHPW